MTDQLTEIQDRCIRIETKLTRFLEGVPGRPGCVTAKPQTWNEAQLVVLRVYCGGEFLHLLSISDVRGCGDGLLVFLMDELSTREHCETKDDAFNRVAVAIEQLREVLAALDSITKEDLK